MGEALRFRWDSSEFDVDSLGGLAANGTGLEGGAGRRLGGRGSGFLATLWRVGRGQVSYPPRIGQNRFGGGAFLSAADRAKSP